MTDRYSKSETAVVFLHIPRAAGTTLHRIIERQYRPEQLYSPYLAADESVEELAQLNEARRTQIRMLRGHMGFGVHKFLPGPSIYVTILREPVDRVVSCYYFIRRAPAHYLHDFIKSEHIDLKAFVENRTRMMVSNDQTRIIAGVWPEFVECNQDLLETAKRNLASCAVVGLAERFDETLLLLKRALGWRNVFYVRQNVTADRPKLDEVIPETRESIACANSFDIALYQYATVLFEEQIRRQGFTFLVELKLFQLVNRLLNICVWAYWQARKVSVRVLVRKSLGRVFSQVSPTAER